jgi:hypothetical protein
MEEANPKALIDRPNGPTPASSVAQTRSIGLRELLLLLPLLLGTGSRVGKMATWLVSTWVMG